MKRINRIACAGLGLSLLMAVFMPSSIHATSNHVIYRLYNPNSGEHFYTAFSKELYALQNAGWQYEGVAWNSPDEGWYVWRLYNPNAGVHHFTMDEDEKNMLISLGWSDEGVGWASTDEAWLPEEEAQGIPVYRLYNPNSENGDHHYTTDANEANALVDAGWNYEGINSYVE